MRRQAEDGPRRPVTVEARAVGWRAWWKRLTLFQAFMLGPMLALAVIGGLMVGIAIVIALGALFSAAGYR